MGRADRVIAFIELLTQTAGPAAGQPFRLRDWQKQIIRGIYEPQDAHDRRAARQALITMPRENGKTELCAALVLYHLLADGEINGQVYSAAAIATRWRWSTTPQLPWSAPILSCPLSSTSSRA